MGADGFLAALGPVGTLAGNEDGTRGVIADAAMTSGSIDQRVI